MKIKTGCDLVDIKKFQKSITRGGEAFLSRIFSTHEIANNPTIENLAGLFAAKESVKKALEIKPDDWKKIEVVKSKTGRPSIRLIEIKKKIISQDISISHDAGFAMATSVFILDEK